jgi:hypothetical protein
VRSAIHGAQGGREVLLVGVQGQGVAGGASRGAHGGRGVMGATVARGYGGGHQALRRRLAPLVAAGLAACSRCGEWIAPDEAWDLDHADDRLGYLGPAHVRCNRGEPGRARKRARSAEARAIAWAEQYERDVARLERERAQRPRPAVY